MANTINADNGVSSGAAGLKSSSDGTGILAFQTNGTTALTIDASQNILIGGASAQTGAVLAVTGGIQGTIKSGTAVASTSGTSIDFTSIPSWVKRITVMFQGVSTNGTSIRLLRIGSGSIETTGYLASAVDLFNTGSVVGLASTTYFPLVGNGSNTATAAAILDGAMQLTLLGSNIWNLTGTLSVSGSGIGAGTVQFAGTKTTSGALDRLRISTLNGTDTFDAGSINILYEG